MTYILVGNLAITSSDIGFSPGWRQAIIWTYARPLGTNFSDILIENQTLSLKKVRSLQ